MKKAFADYSESELAGAIKANWADGFGFFGRSSRVEFDDHPDLMRFSCAVPWAFFNGVFRTKLAPDRVDAAIEETIAYFRSRDVPAFSWWLMPDMQPANLGEYLESHGFALREGPIGMAIDLDQVSQEPSSPVGLSIQVVRNEKTFRLWSPVHAACFGLTDFREYVFDWWMDLGFDLPQHHYLGSLNGEPVAVATLFLTADAAGIYSIGVLPDVRRQGIGTAMTHRLLLDARAQGYRVGVLQASSMGCNVYRRLGFQEYCKMSHYIWKRESQAAV